MDNKKEFKPIAMKCTYEQFKAIRQILETNKFKIESITDFVDYIYLTNNYEGEMMVISNIHDEAKNKFDRTVFEEWNQEIFLESCGIQVKPKFKPIAMKCTEEQFNAIKPILEANKFKIELPTDFFHYFYLTNNFHGEMMLISNIHYDSRNKYNRTVFEEWNQDIFLESCGISTKKIEESNQLNESPFYMVFVEEGNSPSYKHSTYSSAYSEAKRLAKSTGRKAWVIAPLISVELTKFTEEYYSPNMGS